MSELRCMCGDSECPSCGGEGGRYVQDEVAALDHQAIWMPCDRCKGTGRVPATEQPGVTEGKP